MPDAPAETTMRFTTYPFVLGMTLALVLLAFLVNRFAPKKRRHVRRTVIVHLLYVVAFGTWLTLSLLHESAAAFTTRQVGEVLGLLTLVNLGALVVFDLGLPSIGVDPAALVADLAIGLGYIVAVLASMSRFGVQLSGIVTTSALMTTIVAFSLQSTLANVVGGVALQIDDSIHPGDWVQLDNGKQGKVKEIRWRYTVIETRDWDTIIVPNASLLAQNIVILGKREGEPLQHRMWVYFNVDFRFAPSEVINAVNDALQAAPIEGVANEPKAHAIVYDFAKDTRDSFGYYAVRYWLTDLPRDDPTSSRVRERIYAALKRANIPLAIPAAQIWMEEDDAEHRDRKRRREVQARLAALGAVEFLKMLRGEELAHIAEGLRFAPFAAGETITKQGAVAHWLYIVTRGTAAVRVKVEGHEKEVARIGAPGFFGEMGLMTGAPRTATVVASTNVECYRLDKATFNEIIAERPEIAREISEVLADRKVGLEATKQGLDEESKRQRIDDEKKRLLTTIQAFFGLVDEPGPTSRKA